MPRYTTTSGHTRNTRTHPDFPPCPECSAPRTYPDGWQSLSPPAPEHEDWCPLNPGPWFSTVEDAIGVSALVQED